MHLSAGLVPTLKDIDLPTGTRQLNRCGQSACACANDYCFFRHQVGCTEREGDMTARWW